MTTNLSKEQITNLLNGNSGFTKAVIESYICYCDNLHWIANNARGLDAITSDGLKVEFKAIKMKPPLTRYIKGLTLNEHLDDYCIADLFKLYFGTKTDLLDKNLIKTLTRDEFKKFAYDRIVIDKASEKNGGHIVLRLNHNYRTNAMTEKMKSMGLL